MADGGAQLGKLLILGGVLLIASGALLLLSGRWPWLKLGRLPGDFSWTNSSRSVRIYFPLMTLLLLNLLLALIFWLFRK